MVAVARPGMWAGQMPVTMDPKRRGWGGSTVGVTTVATFASGHGWTATAGGGTIDLNDTATPGPFSDRSVKITNGSSGGSSEIDKGSLAVNLSGKTLLLWVKFPSSPATADPGMVVYAGDSAFTNYYVWTLEESPVRTGSGWHVYEMFVGGATTVGSPNVASLAKIRLRLKQGSEAGYSVWFGGIATRAASPAYPNGVLSFAFDDSGASDYTLARTTLANYGFAATAYLIMDVADGGSSSYTTTAQYQMMQEQNGWDIAAHSRYLATHVDFTTLTEGEIRADMEGMKKWLAENGFRGDTWASPYGACNQTVWTIAQDYFSMHRSAGVSSADDPKQTLPLLCPHRVFAHSWDVSLGSTTGDTADKIDGAVANAAWLILNLHSVTSAASSGAAISSSDLATICAHANSSGIAIKTVAEVTNELLGGSL